MNRPDKFSWNEARKMVIERDLAVGFRALFRLYAVAIPFLEKVAGAAS
jgi:hypothetical protein